MVIGIDGRTLQTQPWGGVGQYTYNLLHALFKLDRKNEYAVWYNTLNIWRQGLRRAGGLASSFPTFSRYPNVRIHNTHWPNKLFNLSAKTLNLPKFEIRNLKLEILLMPNLNFIAVPRSTKLILISHDLSFEHFPEHFPIKTRLWHRAVNPRALFSRADHIIAVSEHTKGDLAETYGIRPEKISAIYPGISIQPINQPINRQYILYFGALEPRKNIEGLLEAYELLVPKHGLVLAGLSTPYATHLKKRITKSPLRERITLVENPTEEEKHALYVGATLFVYPSFYEGFGFPPLEAMSAGVPVVASSASSVPEVCGDAALLVSPWNVSEIKEGMRFLLEDENLRNHYSRHGKERVRQFEWGDCASRVLRIFQSVCA